MSNLDEAKNLIIKIETIINDETTRTATAVRSVKSKRTGPEKLDELSLYASKLFKIQGQLAEARKILEEGDISGARWQKARRR